MPCYHPLKVFSRTLSDNKRDLYFVNDVSEWNFNSIEKNGHIYSEKLLLPCGQCIGCRLEYSRQWAMRCLSEAKLYSHNYFVTLTYNDEHLPLNFFSEVDTVTGELSDDVDYSVTLRKSDLSSFIKNLRRQFDYHYNIKSGIRFYACGEYGDLYGRPHYHLILFNCPLNDLKEVGKSKSGGILYESPFLSKVWNKGIVRVNEVNFETCSYVARYMTKKHKGLDRNFYKLNHIEPEFSSMSLKPGIGGDYFVSKHSDIYKYDTFFYSSADTVIKTKPPKYFDRLYDILYPGSLYDIKIRRLNAIKDCFLNTDKSDDDYLEVREKNKLLSLSKLPR